MKILQSNTPYQIITNALTLCGFAVLLLSAFPVQAQDCSSPDGIKGDVIFNTTYDAFQGCTGHGWQAFHVPAATVDPCVTSSTPGTACLDGQTVYAGSWNGDRYYTTVADQGTNIRWKTSLGINDIATDSVVDGRANSNQVPNSTVFPAFKLCKDLTAGGHTDWYLPAQNELSNVLYANRAAIGGIFAFNTNYWSSTESGTDYAIIFSESFGYAFSEMKTANNIKVRCVRR